MASGLNEAKTYSQTLKTLLWLTRKLAWSILECINTAFARLHYLLPTSARCVLDDL